MIFDNLTWHAKTEDYPPEVPHENGATHIGVFLAWAVKNNLQHENFSSKYDDLLQQIRNQEITGRDFFLKVCNEEFGEKCLNEEGQQFAQSYYASHKYITDYAKLVTAADIPSIYHVNDSWKLYALIEPKIDKRFSHWKSGIKWWEFWK